MNETEAPAPVAAYHELSRAYAGDGDPRLAALAAWAADVHTLEGLLRENGLDEAPDPAAQLAQVGDSVAASLDEAAAALLSDRPTIDPADGFSVRAVVDAAREAMVTTFDESVHGLLTDRLARLDHLDASTTGPTTGPTTASATATGRGIDRLAGRPAEELVVELRTAAADCAAMAALLVTEGEPEAAGRLADQADSASFEAYLIRAAACAGDPALATVDLRWDLAAAHAAGAQDRERLVSLLGSAEREALRRLLEPLPR